VNTKKGDQVICVSYLTCKEQSSNNWGRTD